MSEFNPESLENNCRSLRMEPSLSDFQVAWIMDLANKSEQLTAANDSLRKAIEEADMHFDGCSVYLKEPCDCGFDEWKRNALEGGE